MSRSKGIFGKVWSLEKIRSICLRSNAMYFNDMGTTRETFLSSRRKTTNEEEKKPISPKKWRMLRIL